MSQCAALGCVYPTPCPRHSHQYTVITGAPCSGKTTHAIANMAEGDLLIDFDRIAQALSPASPDHDYPEHVRDLARVMRSAAIRHYLSGWSRKLNDVHAHLWLIDMAQDSKTLDRYRRTGATVIQLDPGIEVCVARADELRPPRFVPLIHEWYAVRGKSTC